jgi:hypothetical protein
VCDFVQGVTATKFLKWHDFHRQFKAHLVLALR